MMTAEGRARAAATPIHALAAEDHEGRFWACFQALTVALRERDEARTRLRNLRRMFQRVAAHAVPAVGANGRVQRGLTAEERAARDQRIRDLAAAGMSRQAIARGCDVCKDTVANVLRRGRTLRNRKRERVCR